MEIDVLLDFTLLGIFIATVLLLFTGHFIDLKVEKQNLDLTRNAINLLQIVSTSSPLLVKDSNGAPMKLLFDRDVLDKENKKTTIATESCCSSIQHDFNLEIEDLKTDDKWEMGNILFNLDSQCYTLAGSSGKTIVDMPANVCKGNSCHMARATIELARTPLSDLTYWISSFCTSREEGSKFIPFDPDHLAKCGDSPCGISIDSKARQVCVVLNDDEATKLCKKFSCNSDIEVLSMEYESLKFNPKVPSQSGLQSTGKECFNIKVGYGFGETSTTTSSITVTTLTSYENTKGGMYVVIPKSYLQQ